MLIKQFHKTSRCNLHDRSLIRAHMINSVFHHIHRLCVCVCVTDLCSEEIRQVDYIQSKNRWRGVGIPAV